MKKMGIGIFLAMLRTAQVPLQSLIIGHVFPKLWPLGGIYYNYY